MTDAAAWIAGLHLQPHPEGGFYGETYRCHEIIARDHLPARFGGDRAVSTAIYYLLRSSDRSALHRIKSDEGWHFYDGSALTIHVLDAEGSYSTIRLGRNLAAGEVPQAVVRAGDYFGATVTEPSSYSLVGCTVAPGFDFADFEMPSRQELLRRFPRHRAIIEELTR
jgi:predicted cupin superfamily sugar epimerase